MIAAVVAVMGVGLPRWDAAIAGGPWPKYVLGAFAALIAYGVYGLTGFGSAIVAVPLLTEVFDLRTVIPTVLVLDLCSGVFVGVRSFRIVAHKELARLAPSLLTGLFLGARLLVGVPQRPLLLALGLFLVAYAVGKLRSRVALRPMSAIWAAPLGFLGGSFSALFGVGGPFFVLYLARRIPNLRQLRATISSVTVLSGLARLAIFIGLGLYRKPVVLPLASMLLPFAMGGLALGTHAHRRLAPARVLRLVWTLLILSGLTLLARNV